MGSKGTFSPTTSRSRVSSGKTKKITTTRRKTKVQQQQQDEQGKLVVSISMLPSTRTLQHRSKFFHESYSVGKKLGSGTYSIVREGIPANHDMSTSFSRLDDTQKGHPQSQQPDSYAIK